MGRPKGGTNKSHSKEEKIELVKRIVAGEMQSNISRESGVSESQLSKWTKQYLAGGEKALENKRKPGNPLAKYTRLTPMEMLEYEKYPNILNRQFYAEKPMQKIVTDVTYIKHRGK